LTLDRTQWITRGLKRPAIYAITALTLLGGILAGNVQADPAADALAKLSDPTAIYASGDDLKKWCMQAFIDANAVEEGRARQEQIWTDMWTEIGAALAALPAEVAKAVVALPGKMFEAITGIPSWAFWVGGAVVVVLLGVGVWKLLVAAAPAAGHVVASRYLP